MYSRERKEGDQKKVFCVYAVRGGSLIPKAYWQIDTGSLDGENPLHET